MGVTIVADQNVLRLHVAVEEALHVEVLECEHYLAHVELCRGLDQPAVRLLFHQLEELAARAVLEDVEQPVLIEPQPEVIRAACWTTVHICCMDCDLSPTTGRPSARI